MRLYHIRVQSVMSTLQRNGRNMNKIINYGNIINVHSPMCSYSILVLYVRPACGSVALRFEVVVHHRAVVARFI